MSTWTEHVTAALLGTQRRQAPPIAEAPAEAGDPAGRLLDQAALLTVRRRAGWSPGTAEPIAPAPAETTPVVPPAAARRLRRILTGERARVLPEWLEAAADGGYRVPPGDLPDLLHKGRTDRSLRPHIARVAGRRGVWLAMQNLDWAYLVAVSEGEAAGDIGVWETGTRGQRVARLTWLRSTAPAEAVQTLSKTWAKESAPDRATFLETFESGLSTSDEEFLEAALDDRGQDVRRIAAYLLARLPGTAYAERMAVRGRACLSDGSGAVRARIAVVPPADHDEAMLRDGIPFHAAERIGNRAGWLREILGRAPLATWTELFGASPEQIAGLPVTDAAGDDVRHDKDVHLGWARAAARQHDTAWARALLRSDVLLDETDALTGLLSVLPPDERDAAAADLVRRLGTRMERLVLLGGVPGPWAGDLADAVIAELTATAGEAEEVRFLAGLCRLADERLTPAAAPRVEEAARPHTGSGPLAELSEILVFRHEMLAELH